MSTIFRSVKKTSSGLTIVKTTRIGINNQINPFVELVGYKFPNMELTRQANLAGLIDFRFG